MSEDVTRIYCLVDPRNDLVRYVGQTSGALKTRLAQHVSSSAAQSVRRWCAELAEEGFEPKIELLDVVHLSRSAEMERGYIKAYLAMGYNLLNTYDGGEQLIYDRTPRYSAQNIYMKVPVELLPIFRSVAVRHGRTVSEWIYERGLLTLCDLLATGQLTLNSGLKRILSRSKDGSFLLSHLDAPDCEVVYEPFYGDC